MNLCRHKITYHCNVSGKVVVMKMFGKVGIILNIFVLNVDFKFCVLDCRGKREIP